jgi:hypothetical protein
MENEVRELHKRHVMKRQLFMISEYQIMMLHEISKATGMTMSELVRQGLQLMIKGYADVVRKES